MFSWIPIHQEATKKMLAFPEPQKELLATLREMEQQGLKVISLKDRDPKGTGQSLEQIDPFTFLATFNRGITEDNRRANWQFVKKRWSLQSEVPQDFSGIPTVNSQGAWFFPGEDLWMDDDLLGNLVERQEQARMPDPWEDSLRTRMDLNGCSLAHILKEILKKNVTRSNQMRLGKVMTGLGYQKRKRKNRWCWFLTREPGNDVHALWKLASQAMERSAEIDEKLFDRCCQVRGVGIAKLTIGLFWINPHSFLPCDRKTSAFVEKRGIHLKPYNFQSYVEWLREIFAAIDSDFPTVSHEAWVTEDVGPKSPRYWAYAPGQGAEHWEKFYRDGILAIGWGRTGDLNQYGDKEALRKRMQELWPGPSQVHQARACWDFANVMEVGDIVFAKQGIKKIVGYGMVTGDYLFDDKIQSYKHTRRMKWLGKGTWDLPENDQLAMKTLTNVSGAPEFVERISRLVGFSGDPPKDGPKKNGDTVVTKEMAMEGLFLSESQFDEALQALCEKKNLVLQGPPGVGKTFVASRLAKALIGTDDPNRIEMIQFHQSYSYEDFIQGFRPTAKGTLTFELKDGIFHQFCAGARRNEGRNGAYVFIIDEINRGNLSKIFGELMMLVEPDKRGPEFSIPLAYASDSDDKFYIPANVHIIGTMNTADRSLAMVDYALRRRFRFITLRPEFSSSKFREFLAGNGAAQSLVKKVVERMEALNREIADDTRNFGPGYQIGHSYFCPGDGISPDDAWFRRVVNSEIVPLLQEYWLDDDRKMQQQCEALLS